MEVITICGSLRYQDKMMEVAQDKALEGYCVLTPVYQVNNDIKVSKVQVNRLKKAHLKRIDMCDTVLVLNIDNYIGESTKKEIEYAKKLNKRIIYYSDLI